jgi:aryl-alcohol dehydrogenase-like predicted oxidoreductase
VQLASVVQEIAKAEGATPAQVALAWVLSRGDDVVPIPGTKRRKYLEENLAAADLTRTRAEADRLDAILPPGATSGPRYSPPRTAMIDR